MVGCGGFTGIAREGAEDEAVVSGREAEFGGELDGWEDYFVVEFGRIEVGV